MSDRRCVITGLGVLSPNGSTVGEFWDNCLEGRSGVSRISSFDPDGFPSQIAAEIKGFDPQHHFDKKAIRRSDPVQLYSLHTANEAIRDSGLDLSDCDLNRCGCIIGSGIGGIKTFEDQYLTLQTKGRSKISPFFIPMMISDMCAGLVALKHKLKGPNYATVSACASGSHAVTDAFRAICRGEADVIVSGGAECSITPLSLAGFCSARALSTRNDEPQRASRPFDKGRDGFVMGEGAATLVLEEYSHAKRRGAKIYAEIIGAGVTCDAYHITAPSPDGDGAARAIAAAIADGGIEPRDIDYINSHGTATPLGDIAEVLAIKQILGDHAYAIPVNSTKSLVGHLLGAAGAIESVVCALSIENGVVHPTINLDDPDPKCDLDFVPHRKREMRIRYALSNSFGFGGHNVSLLFKAVEDGKAS
jgi:3-oxoacyl-[acyl-carrier-protein] synthase II